MHIQIFDIIVFFIAYMIISGIWQFIMLKVNKKGYELYKEGDETFFDFMCRYYSNDFIWKLRKRFGHSWIYNSKIYEKFVILKGISLIVFAIIIIILLLLFSKSEYFIWLSIEL